MTKNLLKDLSDSIADAAEKAGNSTVLVDARKRYPASGIAIEKDLVLTADHVVQRDDNIKVILVDGTEIEAKVAGRDPGTDLAVLKLAKAIATPAEVSRNQARVGQFVLAIGRPTTKGIESSFGSVNGFGGPVRTGRGSMLESFIKTDVVSYPGFSGGPLIDGDGTVLGINTSGFGSGGAITIPAEIAWKVAKALAKDGKIKRGYIGVRSQTVELSPEVQKLLKREQESGLLIVGLEKDSPASKGGVLIGDILVGVAGSAVSHHDELFAQLGGDVTGKATAIDIIRGGKLEAIKVTVGER
jgi:S1-C subfamily serine protease